MTEKELVKIKKASLTAIEKAKKIASLPYSKAVYKFIEEHCPVKVGGVYELVKEGVRRKGFTRYVIYVRDIQWFGDKPMINVGGWWLDGKNIPTKWDSMTVWGVGNPAEFVASTNQFAEQHPDTKAA